MGSPNAFCGNLTIASAGTESNSLPEFPMKQFNYFTLHAPAALTGTVGIQVWSKTENRWSVYEEAGSPVVLTAGATVSIGPVAARGLRVVSGSAEAAERVIPVYGSAH